MTGANMPTKLGFFKALSFEKLYKFDNENLLVGLWAIDSSLIHFTL